MGGRGRYLRTTISTDTNLRQLAKDAGDFAVLLFTWMIPHANDDATITGDSEELLMLVFPGRNKTAEDVEAALESIEQHHLIERWNRDEKVVYFKRASFYRCQTKIAEKNRRMTFGCAATPTSTLTTTPPFTEGHRGDDLLGAFERGYGEALPEQDHHELFHICGGWPVDLIEFAAARARTRRAAHPIGFIRAVTEMWRDAGVETLGDAERYEDDVDDYPGPEGRAA